MTNKFLLMSQNTELTQQLTTLCKKARWTLSQITTPTGLVKSSQLRGSSGILLTQP